MEKVRERLWGSLVSAHMADSFVVELDGAVKVSVPNPCVFRNFVETYTAENVVLEGTGV